MLLILPILMPNVIKAGQTFFWIIWINAIFLFTMLLPHQTSHIFPFKSGFKIAQIFKKISDKKADDNYLKEAKDRTLFEETDGTYPDNSASKESSKSSK